jgi:hypothetical protein
MAFAGLALLLSLLAVMSLAAARRPGRVSYRLRWDTGRVEPASQDAADLSGNTGWETFNDRGYRLRLERGYLLSHGAALVACDPEMLGPIDRLRDRMLGQIDRPGASFGFAPRVALAGHSSIAREPTQWDRPLIEDLSAAQDLEFGSLEVASPEWAYCQAHYAIGVSEAEAEGMQLPVELAGGGLYLAGSYWREGQPERSFEIRSGLAWGGVGALLAPDIGASPALRARLEGAELRVDIRRDLGAIFDGIDFETMDAQQQAKAALMAIAGSARFELASGPARPAATLNEPLAERSP